MLVMEALSIILGKATKGGNIPGYKFMGKNGSTELVSHLLFANDMLIFWKDL